MSVLVTETEIRASGDCHGIGFEGGEYRGGLYQWHVHLSCQIEVTACLQALEHKGPLGRYLTARIISSPSHEGQGIIQGTVAVIKNFRG
jgi:hypothetical protein